MWSDSRSEEFLWTKYAHKISNHTDAEGIDIQAHYKNLSWLAFGPLPKETWLKLSKRIIQLFFGDE